MLLHVTMCLHDLQEKKYQRKSFSKKCIELENGKTKFKNFEFRKNKKKYHDTVLIRGNTLNNQQPSTRMEIYD